MEEAEGEYTMGVSEGGEKIESIQKMMVVERGVISRDKQGSSAWSQVLIIIEGIESWSWLVSLLGAGEVGFYIDSTIHRGDSVGIQDMEITHYDSMFGVMEDGSNGSWDVGLCQLQGKYAFMVEATIHLVTASL